MQDLYRALCSLSIYRDMLSADPVRALSAFLRTGGAEQAGALCACLARLHCADSLPRAVLQQMQEQINPYTLALAKGETPEATVARNAARDRGILYAAATAALCGDDMPVYGTALPPAPFDRPWDRAEEAFAAFHAKHGCGPFTRHTAFLWQGERLVPVTRTDPVRLSSLHGYDAQQRVLVRNTQAFLAGRPANHILLYGDRGTGKSSSVKALLNEYAPGGLRMVQVPRDALPTLPTLADLLAGLPVRCIAFVDDLSFHGDDERIAPLKAMLEGGLAVQPDNLLIYATSNRLHLVRESDRDPGERHAADTVQEEISLADRFGITLTYLLPDKERFAQIVLALARQAGLTCDPQPLLAAAERWALAHGGRSPRYAQQFITDLCAAGGAL